MLKVDWQKRREHRKLAVVATPPLDTLSIRQLPSSTRPDWRGRVQGKEHASFGRGVPLPGPIDGGAQMDSPGEENGMTSENMREGEKPRKTVSGIFSKARHPAAQTSSSFQKKDGVFVKYTSFSTGKCSIDRWTLCRSVTAPCKVTRERQIHSPYRKKVCSRLRSGSCMRIHELHWPTVNTFS